MYFLEGCMCVNVHIQYYAVFIVLPRLDMRIWRWWHMMTAFNLRVILWSTRKQAHAVCFCSVICEYTVFAVCANLHALSGCWRVLSPCGSLHVVHTAHCSLPVGRLLVLSFTVQESRSAGHWFRRADDALYEEESDQFGNEAFTLVLRWCVCDRIEIIKSKMA